jgi:acetyl-CoA carboxylase carboxyl transferase subunit alpha
MIHGLEFEAPILEIESKIYELRHAHNTDHFKVTQEIANLEEKRQRYLKHIYGKLTAWQKVEIARHPNRPRFKQIAEKLFTDFMPLAGDRLYKEDTALQGGLARYHGQTVMIIGQERGNNTNSRLYHNFGMAHPEGYRKAMRLMRMAERFHIPLITFVDTPGAHPGIEAEMHGQSEAIARSIATTLDLKIPVITLIIGEGCSGGAIAIAAANKVFMMEHAVYTVISPEGCASILWRDAKKYKVDAAEALKITAQDLLELKIIDGIIPEPLGGAHRFPEETLKSIDLHLKEELQSLIYMGGDVLRRSRQEKFLNMGVL